MYNIHLNLSLFIKLYIEHTNTLLTLLVDTGADISLIKLAHFTHDQINTNSITTLSGIGEGKIKSIGTTHFDIRCKNF